MPTGILSMVGNLAQGAMQNQINNQFGIRYQREINKEALKYNAMSGQQNLGYSKAMADHNFQNQLKMWKATNYSAQMEELKKAGLNPALLYGMSGGGGATTGSSGGSVSGGGMPVSGGGQFAGMGIDMAKSQAELELIKAQTKKLEAEANKTAGVDTDLTKVQIASLTQGIENQKAQEALTWVDKELRSVQASVARQTINDAMKTIENAAKEGEERIRALKLQNDLSEKQFDDKVVMLRKEIALIVAQKALVEASTKNVNQDTKLKAQQILESEARCREIANKIEAMWYNAQQRNSEASDARINNMGEDWDVIKDLLPSFILPLGRGLGGPKK